MEDIASPVDEYENYLAETHAQNVSDYFEGLVRDSGVDEGANAKTVAELKELQSGVSKGNTRRTWWRVLRIAAIVSAVAAGVIGYQLGHIYLLLFGASALFIAAVFLKVNPVVKELNTQLASLNAECEAKEAEAWQQMLPLNSLLSWGTAQRLFEKTLPQFKFDNYFANDRLTDLHSTYGLSPELNHWRSVLYCQSGHLRGNPFAIVRFLHHWMGAKTYSGSLVINWTEKVQNQQGQWVTVQRSQTLVASVTKQHPEYGTHAGVIYGSESAPNLSFSRQPSKLSGRGDGRVTDWQMNRKVKSVERQARKATKSGASSLTVMSNREFEALFNATDRNNEVEFRMLFTALAQQEMVKLLNDNAVGPGDNFGFTKSGAINLLDSAHLDTDELEGDPSRFRSLELADARKKFNDFHNQHFWATFFGFAPLLTIPLYQEERNVQSTSPYEYNDDACFWEHEAMANYLGQSNFQHADSVTQNILRAGAQSAGAGASVVTVTAHGYRGVQRVDEIPTRGGDGRVHLVPVPWVEYIPVEQQSQMLVGATASRNPADHDGSARARDNWHQAMSRNGHNPEWAVLRGVMAASLFRR